MKNTTVNKKVIRAMSIGLAAMMSVQPVLATPVLADELKSAENQDNEENKEETTASEAIEPVQEAVETAVAVTQDISDTFADDVEDTIATLESVTSSSLVEASEKEIVSENLEKIGDVANLLSGANDKVQAVDDVFRSEETDEEKAEAEKIADSIDSAIESQNDALNELNDSINKADVALTVIAGNANVTANEIKDADTVDKADEKLAAVEDAKSEAEKLYEAQKANYEKKAAEFRAEEAKVKELVAEYDKLLDNQLSSDSDLMSAKAELEQANEKLAGLKASLEAAQNGLSSEAVLRLEKALESTSKDTDKTDWNALDVVFEDIIKYYYLPSLGIDAANITIGEFSKPKDSSRNYLEVIITDEDGSITDKKYFNYKRPDETKNSYKSIVIFEKNYAYVDSSDKIVSVDNAIEITASGTKYIDYSNKVIKSDEDGQDIYYKVKTKATDDKVTKSDSNFNEEGIKTTYGSTLKSVSSDIVVDEDGNAKLVEVQTGSITTTTQKRETVSLGDITKTYNTKEKAESAKVNDLINAELKKEGYTLLSGSETYKRSVEAVTLASVSEQTSAGFTTSINLDELKSNNSKFDENNKNQFKDIVKNYLVEQGVSDVSVSEDTEKITFTYKKKVDTAVSVTGSTEEEAKKLLNKTLTNGLFSNLDFSGVFNGNINSSKEKIINLLEGNNAISNSTVKATTKYQLTVSDINCTRTSTVKTVQDDVTLKTTTWNLDKLIESPILNDNFFNYKADESNSTGIAADLREGKLNSSLADKALKDIEDYRSLKIKYEEAAQAAENASAKLDDAAEKLQAVIDAIEEARLNIKDNTLGKLAQLELQLKAAENTLKDAEEQNEKAEKAYEKAAEAYKDVVEKLTKTPETETPVESDVETPETETPAESVIETPSTDDVNTPGNVITDDSVSTPEETVSEARSTETGSEASVSAASGVTETVAEVARTVAVPLAEIPVVGAPEFETGVAGARVEEGVETIDESFLENDELSYIKRNRRLVEGEKKVVKTINDEEVPLAAFPDEEAKKMNWWWLLIIALLGATGEEMYRRNQKKKEEKAAAESSDNK